MTEAPAPHLRAALTASILLATATAQNDECAGAITVGIGITPNQTNVGATTSAGIPGGCGAIGNDVWYRHVATCTGLLTVSTCGATSFDTVVEVFGGNCGSLTSLGCNDDACGLQSSITVPATSGTAYLIRVGGYAGATGTFALTIGCTTSSGNADDHCTGATPLVLGANGPFSNVGYTTSLPSWPCGSGANDRWFSFTATVNGPHTIQTCSPNLGLDSTLQLFAGSCTSLQSIGCNDDSCGLGSSLQANLAAGTTYLIRVGGYSGSTGSFDVVVSIGNGTGAVQLASRSGCGNGTITFTGLPALGSTFTINLGNVTGAPLIGIGFVNPDQLFCGCTFGTDWSTAVFGSSLGIAVPANPSYLNLRFYVQGADLGATGGCGYVLYTLTDSYEITIG